MYKYANDMLPPVMNELFIVNSTFMIIILDRGILYTLIGDIQIFPIDLLIMLVHVYGTFY